MAANSLQDELEALRRELRTVMPDNEPAAGERQAAPPINDARSEIERMLGELKAKFGEAADDAEDLVAAHPFASVAAAFLLGILVANYLSRKG